MTWKRLDGVSPSTLHVVRGGRIADEPPVGVAVQFFRGWPIVPLLCVLASCAVRMPGRSYDAPPPLSADEAALRDRLRVLGLRTNGAVDDGLDAGHRRAGRVVDELAPCHGARRSSLPFARATAIVIDKQGEVNGRQIAEVEESRQ